MPTKKIWGIVEKDYLDGRPPVKPTTSWTHKDVNSERGSEQFIELGFTKETFSRPKPIGTITRTIKIGTFPNEDCIVLDFFAGSGTTAHSAIQLNSQKERNVKYIVVQLPEPLDGTKKEDVEAVKYLRLNKKPLLISEITKERIRKADELYSEKLTNSQNGFKVLKLAETNIRPWESDFDNLEQSLLNANQSIKPDRSAEDVLYEILLKYGIELTVPVEQATINGKQVYVVRADA